MTKTIIYRNGDDVDMTEIDIMVLEQQLFYNVEQRILTDEASKKEMMENPTAFVEKVLKENWGLELKDLPVPQDLEIRVLEETSDTYYVVSSYADSGTVNIPQNVEVKTVVETPEVRYFTMPCTDYGNI